MNQAKQLYAAYSAATQQTSHNGSTLPAFEELEDVKQRAWQAAAAAFLPPQPEKVPGQVLCVRPAESGPYVEYWNTFMMPRSVVDDKDNLDPTIQQILPYVSFYRHVDHTAEDGTILPGEGIELLSYRRGSGSGEVRLIAKRSVGFGGHIDTPPGPNIVQHLHDETAREIMEELGIKVNSFALNAAIITCIRNINFLVFNDGTVNSVHTGLSILLRMSDHTDAATYDLEAGHIEDAKWINVEQLASEELDEYETWSTAVISGLKTRITEHRKALADQRELEDKLQAANDNGGIAPQSPLLTEEACDNMMKASVADSVGEVTADTAAA